MRYYSTGAWIKREEQTRENTIEENDEAIPWDSLQKHFDEFSEKVLPGEKFPSRAVDCDAHQRGRPCSGLGFSMVPFLEPLGGKARKKMGTETASRAPLVLRRSA